MIFWFNLLLLGVSAALLTAASERQITTSDVPFMVQSIMLFNFFATICSYTVMRSRLLYLHPGEIPVKHNKLLLSAVVITTGLIAVYFAMRFNLQQILIAVPLVLLSVAYFLPLVNSKAGKKRLRDFSSIKHLVVGAVWSIATVILVADDLTSLSLWILFLERTFFVASLSMIFDHRDIQIDYEEQYITLITKSGWEISKKASLFLMLLAIAAAIILPFGKEFIVQKISVMAVALVLINQTTPTRPQLWYNIVLESLLVIYALAAML